MNKFILIIVTLILFIVMDIMWFNISVPTLYNPTVNKIQGEDIQMGFMKTIGGIYAWLLLALGIIYLVLPLSKNYKDAFINGLIFGFVVYGVYNGTNYAIFKNWDFKVSFFDNAWGTLASGLVSVGAFMLQTMF